MCAAHKPRQRCSHVKKEIQALLQGIEMAHKADIALYTSGHLSPHSLCYRSPLTCGVSLWSAGRRVTDRNSVQPQLFHTESYVDKKEDALHHFTMTTTIETTESVQLEQKDGLADVLCRGSKKKDSSCVLDVTELLLFKPGGGDDRCWFTRSHLAGLTWKDQLRMRKEFEQLVLRKQDLGERNWMNNSKAAAKHERKLEQVLRKLRIDNQPSREHICVFRRVFDNVCQESKVFGDILREIKVEYDTYLISVLSAQKGVQSMPEALSLGGASCCTISNQELEEARQEVLGLSQKAREALEENQRVRKVLQRMLGKNPEDEEDWKETTQAGANMGEDPNSSTDQVQSRRHQLWNTWQDVQNLERGIKKNTISTVCTSASEECITDTEDDIVRLQVSNEHLSSSNMALEGKIRMVFRSTKVDDGVAEELWEKILIKWLSVPPKEYAS